MTDEALKYGKKPPFVYARYPPFGGNACSSFSLYCTHWGTAHPEMISTVIVLAYLYSHEEQERARPRLMEVIP